MVATLTSKGQITIPNQVRKRLRLRPGDRIEFTVEENGIATMKALARRTDEVFGCLAARRKRTVASAEDMNRLLEESFRGGKR
jgi:AbrB family looped-hinge helix DNA binding protein